MMWTLVFSQEWSAWEVAFSSDTIRTWIFSDGEMIDTGRGLPTGEQKALIGRKLWTDDGRFICVNYHVVRAGFGHCLHCLANVMYLTYFKANYLQSTTEDELSAAWATLGLEPRRGDPPRGGNRSMAIADRLKAMSKSSADAWDNLGKVEQRQRQ
eukprot:2345178-Pyramimonas_sp.AAC.1